MATQTSGNNGQRRNEDGQRRSRERDDQLGTRDFDRDRTRGSESDEEREWRGRIEDRGEDRWREERLSSWDRDRGRGFDRVTRGETRGEMRGDWERGGQARSWDHQREPGQGWADGDWDQRGDQMYGAGRAQHNEYLDDGRFEQRPRGFDPRFERESRYGGDYGGRVSGGSSRGDSTQGMYGGGQSGYGSGQSGNVGRGGYYGQQSGEMYRGEMGRNQYGHGYEPQGSPRLGNRDQGQWQGQRQSFRGKGPQGYMRSDDRIKEDVCEALTQDHDIDATGIEIQVRSGDVTLNGHVPERRMKRIAEDCIEHLPGVKDVQNHLKVQSEPDKMRGTGTVTTGHTGEASKRS